MTFQLFGRDLFGSDATPRYRAVLRRDFLAPPFSVLDARGGDWNERKQQWKKVGLRSELGRDVRPYDGVRAMLKWASADVEKMADSPSIFDPVLTELLYRWFCPPRGHVLDPFAGGSVRGIVAALLGCEYTGIDLRAEQVASNVEQADEIIPREAAHFGAPGHKPRWIIGDARDVVDLTTGLEADFVLSCPPYGDLERYSDDPRDLSTMEWPKFLEVYREVVREACAILMPNRFACFVVGDLRDERGTYRDLPGETVRAFRDARAHLYNDAVLVTMTGTLQLRSRIPFLKTRKLGRQHQDVLVFCKGDPREAARACQRTSEDDAALRQLAGDGAIVEDRG